MTAYFAIELSMACEPAAAAARVRDAVGEASGLVVDASRLSNKALVFKVECYAKQVSPLCEALGRIGTAHSAHEQPVGAPAISTLPSDAEVLVLLHVTLVHGLPDERVELPKVPG